MRIAIAAAVLIGLLGLTAPSVQAADCYDYGSRFYTCSGTTSGGERYTVDGYRYGNGTDDFTVRTSGGYRGSGTLYPYENTWRDPSNPGVTVQRCARWYDC